MIPSNFSRATASHPRGTKEAMMIRIKLLLLCAPVLALVGCAYPKTQMVEVDTVAERIAADNDLDPVCDDPAERAAAADIVGPGTEDAICAATARMR
jgi:hypothetical protein